MINDLLINKKRLILILSAAIAVFALFVGIYFINRNTLIETGVNFYVSPTTATIEVNNSKIKKKNFFNYELPPGNYDIKITAPNFEDKTDKITIKQGEVTQSYIKLNPVNQNGYNLLLNEDEIRVREEVSTNLYSITSAKQLEENPIIKYLPAVTTDWRVDYGKSVSKPDDSSALTIYITTYNDQDRELALKWIKSKGIDPSSLEIVYRYFEE